MSLSLTPVTPGSLTLTPTSDFSNNSYLLTEAGFHILLEDGSGALILEYSPHIGLTPVEPGSLTLTPIS